MKFSSISIRIWVLISLASLFGCGQNGGTVAPASTPTTHSVEKKAPQKAAKSSEPIDRHVSRLILTKHVRCRMGCRHITEHEIREILEKGEINYRKSDPDGHPDPKYALEGQTEEGQHLRVVFAVPSGRPGTDNSLVVVTCIELGVEWQCDCK